MKKSILLIFCFMCIALLTSAQTKQDTTRRTLIYIDNYSPFDVQYAYQILGSFRFEGPFTIPAKTEMQLIQPYSSLQDTPLYWEFWVSGTDCKYGKLMMITSHSLVNFNLVDILADNHGIIINPIDKDGGGPYGQPIHCTSSSLS